METQALLPDPTQKAQIRALLRFHSPAPHPASILSALSGELERYENEIAQLRAALANAETDYATLKEHYGDVYSLFAPIRRLPTEVLVQIFERSEDVGDNLNSPESQMAQLARKSLLTVSQVCIRWHDIVLGTPSFWDTIILYGWTCGTPNGMPRQRWDC
jgi:hypothetical protein